MPKIAIVLAVFQPNADFLRAQLQSLTDQSHKNWELHVVVADKTSKDLAVVLTQSFSNRIYFIEPTSTLNPVQAFEAGLNAAISSDAEVFAFCDQDDIWHPEKLTQCATALRQSNAGLVHCDARIVDSSGMVTMHQPSV